jgi:hypothetical protein
MPLGALNAFTAKAQRTPSFRHAMDFVAGSLRA